MTSIDRGVGAVPARPGSRSGRSAGHRRAKLWRDRLHLWFAAGVGVVMAFPLMYAVAVSLMSPADILSRNPSYWPPRWDNYIAVWSTAPFVTYFVNSIVVCAAITVGSLFTGILAAYVFARARFRGRNLLFMAVLATMMIPFHVTLIPNYLLMGRFGLLDSYVALILPFLASGFSIFFLRQHFRSIPVELDQAARLDGATEWRILWDIIVPMSRPAIAAIGAFMFLSEWNSYIWPLIVTDSDSMRTVQIGLAKLYAEDAEDGIVNWPLVMAGSVLIMLPPVLAFAAAERHLVRGITMGGVH